MLHTYFSIFSHCILLVVVVFQFWVFSKIFQNVGILSIILLGIFGVLIRQLFYGGCVFNDAAKHWQVGFQDPASISALQTWYFYHDIMFYLIVFGVFVVVHLLASFALFNVRLLDERLESIRNILLARKSGIVLERFSFWKFSTWKLFRWWHLFDDPHTAMEAPLSRTPWRVIDAPVVEIIWTLLPAFALIGIGIPSFILLFLFDEFVEPSQTYKVVGHQWYWVYETVLYLPERVKPYELIFESHMVVTEDLNVGDFRLLDVDVILVVPTLRNLRFAVTSYDVLHCWAVPALGVKLDACPGRINETNVYILRPGLFYGQCSEICGTHHGFMPIVVRAVPPLEYIWWSIAAIEASTLEISPPKADVVPSEELPGYVVVPWVGVDLEKWWEDRESSKWWDLNEPCGRKHQAEYERWKNHGRDRGR